MTRCRSVQAIVKKAADYDYLCQQLAEVNIVTSSFERNFLEGEEGLEGNDSVLLSLKFQGTSIVRSTAEEHRPFRVLCRLM